MKSLGDYRLFQNLLKLALWMQESLKGVTIKDIMDRYEVSRRTAERMRDTMASLFPVDFITENDGRQKFFKLRSKRLAGLALTAISEEELANLTTAAKALKRDGLSLQADKVESLSLKLSGALNLNSAKSQNLEDLLRFEGTAMKPAPRLIADQKTCSLIREAMMSFHCIGITYENNLGITKELELIPLGLLFGNRNHYLVAKLAFRDEKKARHFILSRIKNIKILPDVYEEDLSFSLEAHAARSFGTFQEKPFEVEWLFSPNVAENASMMIFHPSQITTHNPDGSLSVKFKAGGRLEMSWHLYTWGNEVKVIKPIDFWEKVPQIPNIIVKEKEK